MNQGKTRGACPIVARKRAWARLTRSGGITTRGDWNPSVRKQEINPAGPVRPDTWKNQMRKCDRCPRLNDEHSPDCPNRKPNSRMVRLTPKGNRAAFIQSLERIQHANPIHSEVLRP